MKKRKALPIAYRIERLIEGKWQTWDSTAFRNQAKGCLTALYGVTRVIYNEKDVTGELIREICKDPSNET